MSESMSTSPRAGSSRSSSKTRLEDIELYKTTSSKRLKSIYSDISRQRVSNPAAYLSNLDWWKRALEAFVGQGLQQPESQDSLILDVGSTLNEKLRYDGVGKPLGLAAVISELRNRRSLIPVDEFQRSQASIYNKSSPLTSRLTSALITPLWRALESLSIVESDTIESEPALWTRMMGKHVVVSLLERAGRVVGETLRERLTSSPADALYDFDTFKRLFGAKSAVFDGVSLSGSDLKVLIKFMSRDQGVLVTDKNVIKVKDLTESTSEITAVDRGILELKIGVENMERQVDDLDKRISETTTKANSCVRAKRKDAALSHLKTRKFLDELRSKRLNSLAVLQNTLLQVEAASQDIEIMSQYESSTATLKAILAHPSLQRDAVDATLEAMADASAAAREVDEAIRSGVDLAQAESGAEIDEDELEKELEALIAEESKDKESGAVVDDTKRERGTTDAWKREEFRALEEPKRDADRIGVKDISGSLSEGRTNMPTVPTGPIAVKMSSESDGLANFAQLENEA